MSVFNVEYSGPLNGYRVFMYDYTWHIAVFVTEAEADNYAEYREAMLKKYDSTDTALYEVSP